MKLFRPDMPLCEKQMDARILQLEFEYFQQSKESSDALLEEFVEWCVHMFSGHFICSWEWKSKSIKDNTIARRVKEENAVFLSINGAIASNQIYNRKTLNQYRRKLLDPSTDHSRFKEVADDYWPFYQTKVEALLEAQLDWKDTISSFFYEPNRIFRSAPQQLDLQGYATRIPYAKYNKLFYGTVNLSISIQSLGSNLQSIAGTFKTYLIEQASKWINLNGRVAITPITYPAKSSGHMYYFGNNISMDGTHLSNNFFPSEWYPHYYICGAEWFNIISPLAQQHIPTVLQDVQQFDMISIQELPGGSIGVQVEKNLACLDVIDLLPVKLLLYNALYPGMSKLSKQVFLNPNSTGYMAKPRKKWECVPILEEEIVITDEEIVFRHKNCRLN